MLTVMIPFHNEAGNVLPLLEEIHEALEGIAFEVICINDASTDATADELSEAGSVWPDTVNRLTLVARRGKSAALRVGLTAVRGHWIQLLDGDGQNDPADARRIWDELIATNPPPRLGLVAGRRTSRKDGAFKWLQSRIANGVRAFALRDGSTDTGCGFKLIRTDVFRELPYFEAMHRFLPALVRRTGWDVVERPVADRPRRHGRSKYGFIDRLAAGLFDLLGMIWLVRRGRYGIAKEWDDPRENL